MQAEELAKSKLTGKEETFDGGDGGRRVEEK
jgi:hypothetical protein